MILRPEPVAGALDALRRPESTVILLDPGGEPFRQARAQDLAGRSHLVIVCPRYEGVDDRIRGLVDLELSIGDYVLSGGEVPALIVIDAVLRLLPGAIDEASTLDESFSHGLLEYPQYTRPATFRGDAVPDDPAERRSWRGRPLAAGAGPGADPTPPARPAGARQRGLSRQPRGPEPRAGDRRAGRATRGGAGASCYTAAASRALVACRPDPVRSDPSVSSAL